jgi:GT2 family glycosyltransferase
MGKIALGFVVYNPPDTLLQRMALVVSAGWDVFIFDNSPALGSVRTFSAGHKSCRYFTAGKNIGLGFGMSTITAQAYYSGYPSLLFFDQDTCFNMNTLAFIERFYVLNVTMANSYSSIVFNSKDCGVVATRPEFVVRDVLSSINSGSLYFLENVRKLNWFDETFFVDCVDYEFCLRSSAGNLKIAACMNTPGYDHITEQEDKSYYVLGKPRRLRRYSRSRVMGTLGSMIKLCWRSAISGNARYLWTFGRSLGLYLFWQVTVRILIVIPWLGRPLALSKERVARS